MKIRNFKFTKSNIASIIIVSFFFSVFMNQLSNINLSSVTFLISLLGLSTLTTIKKSETKIVIWIIVLYIFMLISIFYTKNTDLTGIMKSGQYIIIAFMLYKHKLNPKIMYFSFFIHIIFFIFHMGIATDANEVFQSSRNLISVILIVQTSLLYKSIIENNLRISFLPALISFLISLWAIGRGGIISTSIILIGVLIATISGENKKKNILTISLLTIFLILLSDSDLRIVANLNDNIAIFFERFNLVGLDSNARELLQSAYWHQVSTDAKAFLLGVPIYDVHLFSNFNFNPHNSFIKLHMNYGLGGFVWITLTIILVLIHHLKKRNYLLFSILIAILTRVYVDSVAFYEIMDPILYYFIFSYLGRYWSKESLSS